MAINTKQIYQLTTSSPNDIILLRHCTLQGQIIIVIILAEIEYSTYLLSPSPNTVPK